MKIGRLGTAWDVAKADSLSSKNGPARGYFFACSIPGKSRFRIQVGLSFPADTAEDGLLALVEVASAPAFTAVPRGWRSSFPLSGRGRMSLVRPAVKKPLRHMARH